MEDFNLTAEVDEPQWNSEPAWSLPLWVEPTTVALILFATMWLTRRKGYRILGKRPTLYDSYLDHPDSSRSSDQLLPFDAENEDDAQDPIAAAKHLPKRRNCCGMVVHTPNSSRFKDHIHSRILQRFPFLVEMFYWIITYQFYRFTKIWSSILFKGTGIWNVAQSHGIAVLELEHNSWMSFLFPVNEHNVQQWFMHGHQDALTILNRAYALIHIPGTVGFIAWYYYVAPSHPTFAVVRRTMTLANFMAFVTFIFYPCMPPRLLPKEYGFLDTVHHDQAESAFMSGNYVNMLAAMPSMHFGYAFSIGATLVYHSGIFRQKLEKGESRKSMFWKLCYVFFGVGYPTFILVTIVATANHYVLDTVVAACYVALSFLLNRVLCVFMPLEDLLLWVLRLEKPIPSTGERFRHRGGRI